MNKTKKNGAGTRHTTRKCNLHNFPGVPRSRSNEREFSHWNPNLEYLVAVLRRPTWSGIRTSGLILARQIHTALRNPDVPLGGKP